MSKKRCKRNTKKALKSLQKKNQQRLKRYGGGPGGGGEGAAYRALQAEQKAKQEREAAEAAKAAQDAARAAEAAENAEERVANEESTPTTTEPTEPTEPTDPTEPADPTEPTGTDIIDNADDSDTNTGNDMSSEFLDKPEEGRRSALNTELPKVLTDQEKSDFYSGPPLDIRQNLPDRPDVLDASAGVVGADVESAITGTEDIIQMDSGTQVQAETGQAALASTSTAGEAAQVADRDPMRAATIQETSSDFKLKEEAAQKFETDPETVAEVAALKTLQRSIGTSPEAVALREQMAADPQNRELQKEYEALFQEVTDRGKILGDKQQEAINAAGTVEGAQGELSEGATAATSEQIELTERAVAAERDTQAEQEALAETVDFSISEDAYVDKVTGEKITVASTPEAEAQQREAILGEPVPDGEAAKVMSMYDFAQAQQRRERGDAARKKVTDELTAQGMLPDEIAQELLDNPARLAAAMEDQPDTIKTALSGLSEEALMSTQMESLMAGMDDGKVPAWARPALASVEANLARRGMSTSTVGRDALFNAIIQSAIPIAQSNSQAIQAATAQDKTLAGQFLIKNAEFAQQMELANMSKDQQMNLANLSALNQASSDNLNAAQQTELANLNMRMNTNLKQADIAAQMGVAQLNVDQQKAVNNAMMVAQVDMSKFTAEQQTTLANSNFMQTMVSNKFNADQQATLQNATAMANLDMATADQRTKVAISNANNFLQMDMSNLNNEQQAAMLSAQNDQQRLLSDTAAANAAKQFNASSQNQTDQFMASLGAQIDQYNASALDAMDKFNASEVNRMEALNTGNEQQMEMLNAQMATDANKFNATNEQQRDQWNAANAQAIEQANMAWRRSSNTAETAAANAANQQNVQNSYNLSSLELGQMWQQLRDESTYMRTAYEAQEQRVAQLYATVIGNENATSKDAKTSTANLLTTVNSIYNK